MDKYDIINGHQHCMYDVPDHEVLISFNNDNDAYAFVEWFEDNRELFETYFKEHFDG